MRGDILFLSTNLYDPYLPLRKYWLSRYFSENGFRVIFVEFPHTYFAYIKKGFGIKKGKRLEKLSDSLFILKSFPILPFFKKYSIINKFDNIIFYGKVKEILKEINFDPIIVWTYPPFFPEALKYFNSKIVYDCVDDYSSLPGLINSTYVLELEKRTVEIADKIVSTDNTRLVERIRTFGKEPTVISNGVDYELFSGFLNKKDVLDIKKRIIYVGNVSYWFDLELIKKISDSFKDYEITIIGFASKEALKVFQKIPNLVFAGKLKQEQLVPILTESSVAIIPFKINDLTKATDPLKVYEYLAAGVPVVSTPVGSIDRLPILIGNTQEEFIEKIKVAINTDSFQQRKARSDYAKAFSWETKYRKIEKILQELM